jgi:hypothetical protein
MVYLTMKSFSIYRKFDVDLPAFHVIAVTGNQAIAKCLKKVIELQVPLLHQNVTEY